MTLAFERLTMTPAFELFKIIRRLVDPLNCVHTTSWMNIRLYEKTSLRTLEKHRKIKIKWKTDHIALSHGCEDVAYDLADPDGISNLLKKIIEIAHPYRNLNVAQYSTETITIRPKVATNKDSIKSN